MYPIFKNAETKFEDTCEYMQKFHTEHNISFKKGNALIGSYLGKEISLYSQLPHRREEFEKDKYNF
jgi:hypothetical protein